MHKLKTILLCSFIVGLLASSAYSESSANYNMTKEVFSSAGGSNSSSGKTLLSVMGQSSPIGKSASTGFVNYGGFIHPKMLFYEIVTKPAKPSGENNPIIGTQYRYSTSSATSNVGNPIEYRFIWGDGTSSQWASNTFADKTWNNNGQFNIKTEARSTKNIDIVSVSDEMLINASLASKYSLALTKIGKYGKIKVNNIVYDFPFSQEFNTGSEVTVQSVTDNSNCSFTGWSGDFQSSINPISIAMGGNKNINASFSCPDEYTLTIEAQGQGKVVLDGTEYTLPLQKLIVKNSSVAIEAIALTPSWQFAYWSGDNTDSTTSITMNVTRNVSLKANFIIIKYALKVDGEGNVKVCKMDGLTRIGEKTYTLPIEESFEKGSKVRLESLSSDFKSWEGDATGSSNPIFVDINSAKTVRAVIDATVWKATINAQNMNSSSGSDVIIGMATLEKTKDAAPLLPEYYCNMVILPDATTTKLFEALWEIGENSYAWVLSVNPHGNVGSPAVDATTTLSWNATELYDQGYFQIRKGKDGLGEIVVKDMRKTTSMKVIGKNSDQQFTVIWSSEPFSLWETLIHAEGQSNDTQSSSDVTIGVANSEAKKDAPPDAPSFSTSIAIISDSERYAMDIKADGEIMYSWVVAINPHGNIGNPSALTSTVSWKTDSLNPEGYFMLKKGSDGKGDIIVPNMRTKNSIYVTGNNTNQYFTIVWTEKFCHEFRLKKGWNLISLPLTPEFSSLAQIFPKAIVAYYYGKAYAEATQLEPGIGYWVKLNEDAEFLVFGEPYTEIPEMTLSPGWHLMGSIYINAMPIVGTTGTIDKIYEYLQTGAYNQVSEIKPGLGVWVKIKSETTYGLK